MTSGFMRRAFGGVDPGKLRNMGWIFLQQGTSLVAGFIFMIFLARHLGPDLLAAYAWIFSLVLLASPLALSAEQLVTRRLLEAPEAVPRILGSGLLLHVVGAVIGMASVLLVAGAVRPEAVPFGAIAAGALLLPAFALVTFDTFFRAGERIAVVSVPKTLSVGIGTAVGLGLIAAGAGLIVFVWLRVAQTAAAGFASALWYLFRGPFRGLAVSAAEFGHLLRQGWPMFAAGLISVAHLRIDQIMLGSMAPMPVLADYALAARLAETIAVFQVALNAAFYPSLVRAFKRAPENFDAHMQRYYDLHALAGMSAGLLLAAAGLTLFVPMFGVQYGGGVVLVCILALAAPVQMLDSARGSFLTIRGWMRTGVIFTGFALALNVASNFVLIPRYGAEGAAWATVASTWATCFALPFVVTWMRPFQAGAARAMQPWRSGPRVWRMARGGAGALPTNET